MIYKSVSLILTTIVLVGCSSLRPSRTCAEIEAQGLRGLVQHSRSPDEMQSEIAKSYDLPLEQIHALGQGFGWSKDDVIGEFTMDGTIPVAASLNYKARQPSLGSVIRCLGSPTLYRAHYRYAPGGIHHTLDFELYYIQQGIMALTQLDGFGNQVPRLDGNTPIVFFSYVPVDSNDKTLDRLTAGITYEMKQEISPWPGNFDNITVKIDPSLQ